MTPGGKRRLSLLGALLVAGAALGVVAFGNIGENLVYFWDVGQLVEAGDDAVGATVRLGGLVVSESVEWDPDSGQLRFEVTDGEHSVMVEGSGAPPEMFRAGIGVVVEGTLKPSGLFVADRIMVKHSNEYRAPQDGVETSELYETVEGL
ncbi:MAG: cytochrome c maturation protein CcmE [Myxococcota bacterium]|nr:cytochrome c maturation protein CcmE [Myxococcota bacterium]